jgi:hypothetical protein
VLAGGKEEGVGLLPMPSEMCRFLGEFLHEAAEGSTKDVSLLAVSQLHTPLKPSGA